MIDQVYQWLTCTEHPCSPLAPTLPRRLRGRPQEVLREGVQGREHPGRQHLALPRAARLPHHRHAQQARILPELPGKDSQALGVEISKKLQETHDSVESVECY